MTPPLWCLPLSAISRDDLTTAGGKGANLGELMRAGFAVPPGFVVTTDAYRAAVAGLTDPDADSIRSRSVPEQIRQDVLAHYAQLGGGVLAVRSSATTEDLPGAAFAGQQDTYLGVVGDDQLIEAVRNCWASLWTDRAISYRARLGIDPLTVAIAVVVQRLVPAEQAGVMFTANPMTGDRDQVVIDSSPGLGESVVSGLVTPDHAVLDGAGRVVQRRAGRPEKVIHAHASGGTWVGSVSNEAPLTEVELAHLAEVGRNIAAHFARPQDIEWAISAGQVAVLQARPMTALPPAPVQLTAQQRKWGSIVFEMLPRRPLPMEVSVWLLPVVGPVVEGMAEGLFGIRIRLGEMFRTEDGVVQEVIPPRGHATIRTPVRLGRVLRRMRHDPRAWHKNRIVAEHCRAAAALAATDVSTASWDDLMDIPKRAAEVTAMVTEIRVRCFPGAMAALGRLTLVLRLLGLGRLWNDLVLDAPTLTKAANTELAGLAQLVRDDPVLRGEFDQREPVDLWVYLQTDPAATAFRQQMHAFLGRYGHRETASLLLLQSPTWADSPETVLTLVRLLIDHPEQATGPRHRPASETALALVLNHPAVRRTHTEPVIRRVVAQAAAGIALREDSHFEVTRTMPLMRRVVLEIGQRMAAAGVLADAADIWFLTWPEVASLPEPRPLSNGAVDDGLVPDGSTAGLRGLVARRRAGYEELKSVPLIAPSSLYPDRLSDVPGALVRGIATSPGRVHGPVRIVRIPQEFGTLRAGEILVCPSTNPSWTPLFARAAAVVVDNGGLASHAAIVAREYGIPAIMGAVDATAVLTAGQRVVVDGDLGAVLPDPEAQGDSPAGTGMLGHG